MPSTPSQIIIKCPAPTDLSLAKDNKLQGYATISGNKVEKVELKAENSVGEIPSLSFSGLDLVSNFRHSFVGISCNYSSPTRETDIILGGKIIPFSFEDQQYCTVNGCIPPDLSNCHGVCYEKSSGKEGK